MIVPLDWLKQVGGRPAGGGGVVADVEGGRASWKTLGFPLFLYSSSATSSQFLQHLGAPAPPPPNPSDSEAVL